MSAEMNFDQTREALREGKNMDFSNWTGKMVGRHLYAAGLYVLQGKSYQFPGYVHFPFHLYRNTEENLPFKLFGNVNFPTQFKTLQKGITEYHSMCRHYLWFQMNLMELSFKVAKCDDAFRKSVIDAKKGVIEEWARCRRPNGPILATAQQFIDNPNISMEANEQQANISPAAALQIIEDIESIRINQPNLNHLPNGTFEPDNIVQPVSIIQPDTNVQPESIIQPISIVQPDTNVQPENIIQPNSIVQPDINVLADDIIRQNSVDPAKANNDFGDEDINELRELALNFFRRQPTRNNIDPRDDHRVPDQVVVPQDEIPIDRPVRVRRRRGPVVGNELIQVQPLLNDDPIVAQLDVSENRTIRFDNIGVSVIEAPENETDIDFNLNIDDATNQQPLQPESLDENGLPLERNTPSRTPSGLQTAINKLGKKAQSRRKTHTIRPEFHTTDPSEEILQQLEKNNYVWFDRFGRCPDLTHYYARIDEMIMNSGRDPVDVIHYLNGIQTRAERCKALVALTDKASDGEITIIRVPNGPILSFTTA